MDAGQVQEYIGIALQVIGVAGVIATFTPTPIDNMVLVGLRKALNLIAMNWGQSENLWKPGDPEIRARKRNRKPRGK